MNGITSSTFPSLLKCWQLKKVLNLYISTSLIFYFQLLSFSIIFINIYLKTFPPKDIDTVFSLRFVYITTEKFFILIVTFILYYFSWIRYDLIYIKEEKKLKWFPGYPWVLSIGFLNRKEKIAVRIISFHSYYGTTHSSCSIKELSPEDLI